MAQHVLHAPPACLDPEGSPRYGLDWPIYLWLVLLPTCTSSHSLPRDLGPQCLKELKASEAVGSSSLVTAYRFFLSSKGV